MFREEERSRQGSVRPEELGIFNERQRGQRGWNVVSKGESRRRGSRRERFKRSLCGPGWGAQWLRVSSDTPRLKVPSPART